MALSTLEVAQAQQRLEDGIVDLDDEAMAVASHCDGWTRGHVLTHIARNADGMVNLTTWALTGEVKAMYSPPEARDDDIAAGASRSAVQIINDVVAGNQRVLEAFARLEAAVAVNRAVADRMVRLGTNPEDGPEVAAQDLPHQRIQEVVLHHHDLLHDLALDEWPRVYVDEALPRAAIRMSRRVSHLPTLVVVDDAGRHVVHEGSDILVKGSARLLLAWLTGRAQDDHLKRLDVVGGALSELPGW